MAANSNFAFKIAAKRLQIETWSYYHILITSADQTVPLPTTYYVWFRLV